MNTRLSAAQIRDEQWIPRYVSGRLSEAEIDAFEEFCIANPAMVDEVALENRMKTALATATRHERSHRWTWAAAAAVALALFGGLFAYLGGSQPAALNDILADIRSHESGGAALERIRLGQLRGAQPPRLGAASQALIELQLTGAFVVDQRYDVALLNTDETPARQIATLAEQLPSSERELPLVLNAARIPGGSYSLNVTSRSTGDVQEYEFRKD